MDAQSTITLHTGRSMPVIGLGTWQLSQDTAGTIAKALEMGYGMIDTSGDYGTQPGIGEGIKLSGKPRDSMFIVTKVEETDDAYEATKQNLQELQLDYVDLILIHRPPPTGVGQELWEGLITAKYEGLTKDIGVSNYSIEQLSLLIESSGEKPVVNQIEWTPFGFSQDMYQYCQDEDIIIQAYSPLTRGTMLSDEAVVEIAERYQKTPAQLLLRWNVQRGTVPLPKANQESHLTENLAIFDFTISDDDMESLNQLNDAHSSLGSRLQYE